MARLTRLVVPGQAHHVLQRSAAGAPAFVDDEDRRAFVETLARSAPEHRVAVHGFVLLDHEFQLLATPAEAPALGRLMQSLARRYAGPFNRRHGRAGTLWQGRFRAGPVEGQAPLLEVLRYIEQAPQRAGWAGGAAEYPWSSARHHAGLDSLRWLANLPAASPWWALGNTPFEREAAWRRRLDEPLPPAQLAAIERTTLKGWALGSAHFLALLPRQGARAVAPKPRGRPPKPG